MKEEKDELKELARLARNRMKSGYWTRVKEQRKSGMAGTVPEQDLYGLSYSSFVRRSLQQEKKPDEEEERFRERVEELLQSEEEVVNPIGRLIDTEYYEKLDYSGKQRYILELSEKYRMVAATIVKGDKPGE